MSWRRPGDKPLSEPMMVSLLTQIWVTRPQWVNVILAVSRWCKGYSQYRIRQVWFKPANSPVSPYKSRPETQNIHHPWPALYMAAYVFGHPHMHKNAHTQWNNSLCHIRHQRPWSWHCCHYFTKVIFSNKMLFLVCMFVLCICGGYNKWSTTTGIIAI